MLHPGETGYTEARRKVSKASLSFPGSTIQGAQLAAPPKMGQARLQPILHEQPPTGAEGEVSDSIVPLARKMMNHCSIAAGIRDHLHEILRRIDL